MVIEHGPHGRIIWLVDELTMVCREAPRPSDVPLLALAYPAAVRRLRNLASEVAPTPSPTPTPRAPTEF